MAGTLQNTAVEAKKRFLVRSVMAERQALEVFVKM